MKRIKVIHVITSMLQDGAQHMLLRVVSGLDSNVFDSVVINLRGPTPLCKEFENKGITIHSVDIKKHDPFSLLRLLKIRKLVVAQQPDILQGWMEHSNLCVAWLAKSCAKKPVLFWNIRRSLYNIIKELLRRKIVPHIAFNQGRRGLDARTTRHKTYSVSQRKRKLVEQGFGWLKTIGGLRKTTQRGTAKTDYTFSMRAAVYNIMRLITLCPV